MALVKCKECGNKVSNKAGKCPHCGVKITKHLSFFEVVVALFFAWILISIAVNSDKTTTPEVESKQIANEAPSEATSEAPAQSETKISLDEANKQINIVWQGTTKEIRKQLLPEQREWLKKREDSCKTEPNPEDCMVNMTIQRTEELKQQIAVISETPKNNLNERVIETDSLLNFKNGRYFFLDEKIPFTGISENHYENGQKRSEEHFVNGQRNGLSIHWNENGRKIWQLNYKDNIKTSFSAWDENEQQINFAETEQSAEKDKCIDKLIVLGLEHSIDVSCNYSLLDKNLPHVNLTDFQATQCGLVLSEKETNGILSAIELSIPYGKHADFCTDSKNAKISRRQVKEAYFRDFESVL